MANKTDTQAPLLEAVETHVKELYQEVDEKQAPFHNLEHTQLVVKGAREIAEGEGVEGEDLETLLIAAWFHDTGNIYRDREHEKQSCEIAADFLKARGISDERIQQIIDLIMATEMPQQPQTHLQSILCDADLYHLASPDYDDWSDKLRKEMSNRRGEKIKKKEWTAQNIGFFELHNYLTDYAKEHLEPTKQENFKQLVAHFDKKYVQPMKEDRSIHAKMDPDKAPDLSELMKRPDRGIETMFRTTSRNSQDLSAIADNKANIMISVNSIIVSLMISVLVRKFEQYPHLILPTILLMAVCLAAMTISILATRPNITSGRFTQDDIANRRTNLLFFGNFHRVSAEEYEMGMKQMITDPEYLYSSMIKDIYYLGKVLARKYHLLRISYTIFMYGFIVAAMAYAVAAIFFRPGG